MPTSKPASNKERVLDELRLIKPRNSAGRNLPVAITVGVALGAVVIIGLLLGALAWTVLVAAAVGLATWEVCERLRESDWQVPRPVLILGGQLMVWLSAYWGIDGLVMGLAATLMLLLVVRLFLHGMAEALAAGCRSRCFRDDVDSVLCRASSAAGTHGQSLGS